VAPEPLARQRRQRAVPVVEHCCQRFARATAEPGNQEKTYRALQLALRAAYKRIRVRVIETERRRELGTLEALARIQEQDGAIALVQPRRGCPHECRGLTCQDGVGGLIVRQGDVRNRFHRLDAVALTELTQAHVSRDREHPAREPLRIAQLVEPLKRQHERVLRRVRGFVAIA